MSFESCAAGGRGYSRPRRILLFSGKRKSGKDHITDMLFESIGKDRVIIIKISSPIKSHWAEVKGLHLDHLMSSDEYKEKYRQEMIEWSEAVRDKDPGYFCKKAVAMYHAHEKPIWIVSDIRRQTDIAWFLKEFGDAVRTIRVTADDDVRMQRGFVFTSGVDDKPSECDLDKVTEWHWEIKNNGDEEKLAEFLEVLVDNVKVVA